MLMLSDAPLIGQAMFVVIRRRPVARDTLEVGGIVRGGL